MIHTGDRSFSIVGGNQAKQNDCLQTPDLRILRTGQVKLFRVICKTFQNVLLSSQYTRNIHVIKSNLQYVLYIHILECGGVYTTQSSTITHSSYPNNYQPNLNCKYVINAPRRYQIVLYFNLFDIEKTSDCRNDYITISEGADADERIIVNRFRIFYIICFVDTPGLHEGQCLNCMRIRQFLVIVIPRNVDLW